MPEANIIPAKGPTIRMRVTEAERRLLLARRGAAPPFRLPVVSGYREPTTIPELVEIVRSFLETNFGFLLDDFSDQPTRLDIQSGYNDDDLPHTTIYLHEEANWNDVFDALTPDEAKALAKYRAGKEVADGR